jgi:hypothetical protein
LFADESIRSDTHRVELKRRGDAGVLRVRRQRFYRLPPRDRSEKEIRYAVPAREHESVSGAKNSAACNERT